MGPSLWLRPLSAVLIFLIVSTIGVLSAPASGAEASSTPAVTKPDAAAKPEGAAKPAEGPAARAPELLLWEDIPTVVSASRHKELVSQAPNAVSIITAEDIHTSGLTKLGDLLRLAPGVDVGQIDGNSYAIGVRGMHGKWANSTLVLMDGRSVYNPMTGGTLWGAVPVFLEDIERIEVVRGPGGAAWGANAVNGVINIITKKPEDTPGFFINQVLTNRLDTMTHLRYGLSEGPLSLRISAGYYGLPETGVREGPPLHDFARTALTNLRSTYRLNKQNTLDIDAGYLDGVEGAGADDAALSGQSYANARMFPQSQFLRTRFTHTDAPDDLWYLQYFWNQLRLTESEGGLAAGYNQHDLEAQRVQRLDERNLLTYGGNVRMDLMESGDPPVGFGEQGARLVPGNSQDHQAGLFVQDRFDLSEQWSLVGGVRADVNAFTGWEWSGRGAVLFHPAREHTFRIAVARAFRTPTMLDRKFSLLAGPTGLPLPFPQAVVQWTGNEDLNSSYMNAYEFGYAYEKSNLRLNAEFFYDDYRGIMAGKCQTAPGVIPMVFPFENAIDGHLYGYELSGQYRVTKTVRVDGYYVWEQWVQPNRFEWPSSVTLTAACDAALPPQQKVSAGVSWEPIPDLMLTGRMWCVDRSEALSNPHIAPYARFDFGAIKRFGKNIELAVGVQNAFDARHPEASTFALVPVEAGERTWYVRFQARF